MQAVDPRTPYDLAKSIGLTDYAGVMAENFGCSAWEGDMNLLMAQCTAPEAKISRAGLFKIYEMKLLSPEISMGDTWMTMQDENQFKKMKAQGKLNEVNSEGQTLAHRSVYVRFKDFMIGKIKLYMDKTPDCPMWEPVNSARPGRR